MVYTVALHPPVHCVAPSAEETYSLLRSMKSGFSSYPNKLPRLGAWTPVADAVKSISRHDDERIKFLVRTWGEVDIRLRSFARSKLVPAHGDAHLGNLIASPYGWLWMDLEDVSLMPPLWDLATMVGRSFLFQEAKGFFRRTYQAIWNLEAIDGESGESFDLRYFPVDEMPPLAIPYPKEIFQQEPPLHALFN